MDSTTFFSIPYNTQCAFEVKTPDGSTKVLYGAVFDKTMNLWDNEGRTIILDSGEVIKAEDVVGVEHDPLEEVSVECCPPSRYKTAA